MRKSMFHRARTQAGFASATASFQQDDEFERLVRMGLGKNSSLMIRKDRQGIAIQKGSKKHKITFRDEIGGFEA